MNIETIRRGLRGGFLPALLVGCGSTIADIFYISLVYVGVAALVSRPLFRIVLDAAAALVLGLLAWTSLREGLRASPSPDPIEGPVPSPPSGALASGFLITLTNPMTVVFYLSLFGGAVATLHEESRQVHLVFVASVVAGCLLWSLFLALVLGWGQNKVGLRLRRGISLVSGLALAFFAARFLVEGFQETLRRGG